MKLSDTPRKKLEPKLERVDERKALEPRRDPYWQRLAEGRHVGFRRMAKGATGTWLARIYRAGKYHQNPLGDFADLNEKGRFDAAVSAAQVWFAHMGAGGKAKAGTVREACEAYVEYIRGKKDAAAALDAEGRFKRLVYEDKIACIGLSKLTSDDVDGWRNRALQALKKSRAGFNRNATSLRAALNLAKKRRKVATDDAWKAALEPFQKADGRRELYLDIEQRRRFIEEAQPDLAKFLRGLALLPLRPGALAELKVGDYDARLSRLKVGEDKDHKPRHIKLPPSTAAFFDEAAKGRPSAAPMLAREGGQAWNKDAWKWPVKLAAKAAGLPDETTAYAMRHSVITDLVHGGTDLLTVAQMSGTSVKMIEEHYGQQRDDVMVAALAKLAL